MKYPILKIIFFLLLCNFTPSNVHAQIASPITQQFNGPAIAACFYLYKNDLIASEAMLKTCNATSFADFETCKANLIQFFFTDCQMVYLKQEDVCVKLWSLRNSRAEDLYLQCTGLK